MRELFLGFSVNLFYVFGRWRESVFKPRTLIKKSDETVWMKTTNRISVRNNRCLLAA
jgi:hypothetical protein